MVEKACMKCKKITEDDVCPICNEKTSSNWSGLLIIIDPDTSEIAETLNMTTPGRYALKVSKK
ncbi:MAG: transcription elongation factor subunit Spt4 [Methanobacteriaceae archaeon]|nr:transcription elongation factor subunit Spt4 [Methanobacteriaceae archaeon]